MKKYTLLDNGTYKNNETGATGIRPGNWLFEDVQEWLNAGNTPDPEFTIDQTNAQACAAEIAEIDAAFAAQSILSVDCNVGDDVYTMDGKEDSATRFKHGIELAQLLGLETITLVDYHNRTHTVSLADALTIVAQQGAYYACLYQQRAAARQAVLNAYNL